MKPLNIMWVWAIRKWNSIDNERGCDWLHFLPKKFVVLIPHVCGFWEPCKKKFCSKWLALIPHRGIGIYIVSVNGDSLNQTTEYLQSEVGNCREWYLDDRQGASYWHICELIWSNSLRPVRMASQAFGSFIEYIEFVLHYNGKDCLRLFVQEIYHGHVIRMTVICRRPFWIWEI